MKRSKISLTPVLILAFMVLALTLVFAQPASAQTESVLYSFVTGDGAQTPYGSLITDSAGNLYGAAGSDTYDGVAYELIPSSGGVWTLKILHEFTSSDNVGPSAGFTMDTAGNLYAPSQSAAPMVGARSSNSSKFRMAPGGRRSCIVSRTMALTAFIRARL